MRKNARIIQISGLKGLIFAAFVVICLIMGFVAFPGIVAMCLWNMASGSLSFLPQINIFQGILLWVIIALAIYVSGGSKTFVALKQPAQLSESEVRDLMLKIKTQAQARQINAMILKSDELKELDKVENKELKNSVSVDENDKEKL